MSAPCAGFVWFRWFRPGTWHVWKVRECYPYILACAKCDEWRWWR